MPPRPAASTTLRSCGGAACWKEQRRSGRGAPGRAGARGSAARRRARLRLRGQPARLGAACSPRPRVTRHLHSHLSWRPHSFIGTNMSAAEHSSLTAHRPPLHCPSSLYTFHKPIDERCSPLIHGYTLSIPASAACCTHNMHTGRAGLSCCRRRLPSLPHMMLRGPSSAASLRQQQGGRGGALEGPSFPTQALPDRLDDHVAGRRASASSSARTASPRLQSFQPPRRAPRPAPRPPPAPRGLGGERVGAGAGPHHPALCGWKTSVCWQGQRQALTGAVLKLPRPPPLPPPHPPPPGQTGLRRCAQSGGTAGGGPSRHQQRRAGQGRRLSEAPVSSAEAQRRLQ